MLRRTQQLSKAWSDQNFGTELKQVTLPCLPLLGVMEELGELCHSHLKQEQGIRGTPEEHVAKAKDAVGDILIYLLDYCNRRGWDVEDILAQTASEVFSRDWVNHPETGV